jgi:putative redox protein
MREVRSITTGGPLRQAIQVGPHTLAADESDAKGGNDEGPEPHELLLSALASCMAMTMQAYAKHKGLALRQVEVRVRGRHEDGTFVIERDVKVEGDLDEAQRARVIEIGGRCPVARTLSAPVRMADAG